MAGVHNWASMGSICAYGVPARSIAAVFFTAAEAMRIVDQHGASWGCEAEHLSRLSGLYI